MQLQDEGSTEALSFISIFSFDQLFGWALLSCHNILTIKFSKSFSFVTVIESGDEPSTCMGSRTLILANHQSTADVPMLMTAWNPRRGLLSNLMWIMDRVFKFTNFGIVSVLHEDFFIQAVSTFTLMNYNCTIIKL